jgi:ubiquinone/menaquinone biosynthesis C-methylase UbiE
VPTTSIPDWQLPKGMTRGLWEYAQSEHIAYDYDEFFAFNSLFDFDAEVIDRHLVKPGLVADLGCGTGRAIVRLARRGFPCLAVDLSQYMLEVVGDKADEESLPIWRVQANMTQMGWLRDASIDYCLSLFSTLGMVRGRPSRQRVLQEVRRILKPGGLLVLHVHNWWFNLMDAHGRASIARSLARRLWNRDEELGDRFFDYRGIPNMFLHLYTHRELTGDLRLAGLRIKEMIPLALTRDRALARPWWFGRLRANGWIVVAEAS